MKLKKNYGFLLSIYWHMKQKSIGIHQQNYKVYTTTGNKTGVAINDFTQYWGHKFGKKTKVATIQDVDTFPKAMLKDQKSNCIAHSGRAKGSMSDDRPIETNDLTLMIPKYEIYLLARWGFERVSD